MICELSFFDIKRFEMEDVSHACMQKRLTISKPNTNEQVARQRGLRIRVSIAGVAKQRSDRLYIRSSGKQEFRMLACRI